MEREHWPEILVAPSTTAGPFLRTRLVSEATALFPEQRQIPPDRQRLIWQVIADYGPFVRPICLSLDKGNTWQRAVKQSVEQAVCSAALLEPAVDLGHSRCDPGATVVSGPYVSSLLLATDQLDRLLGAARPRTQTVWVFSNSLIMTIHHDRSHDDTIQSIVRSLAQFSITESSPFSPVEVKVNVSTRDPRHCR